MIASLTLSNFRNHESFRVRAESRNIVITGANGAGKTAVLEAASMLCPGATLRGASALEIVRMGCAGFAVNAVLADGTELSISFSSADSNRRLKIDGDSAPMSDLPRHVRMVWLTPKEDRLFADSPESRRAFFDRMAASFDAAHAGRVARLSKLLSERAFALKSGGDSIWLDSIEKQLAPTAVAAAAARVKYAAELNYFLDCCKLGLDGMLESRLSEGSPAAEIEKEYLNYLSENRFLTGDKMSVAGAHRTDFTAFNEKLGLAVFMTSTGQQKRAVLDFVLAHAKLVAAKTEACPVILLDEAASHLDENSRAEFFAALSKTGAQVWATGTDSTLFAGLPGAEIIELRIEN
jgi:DNA replication and repair protein RecF